MRYKLRRFWTILTFSSRILRKAFLLSTSGSNDRIWDFPYLFHFSIFRCALSALYLSFSVYASTSVRGRFIKLIIKLHHFVILINFGKTFSWVMLFFHIELCLVVRLILVLYPLHLLNAMERQPLKSWPFLWSRWLRLKEYWALIN